VAVLRKILFEVGHVEFEYGGNADGVLGGGIPGGLEELDHDLRIGLPIKPDPGVEAEHNTPLGKCGVDGAPACAGAQEKSPVDVEENQLPLHSLVGAAPGSPAQARQSVTPWKLQMTQMNVPQRVQGYPSEARSSRPQARHTIMSVAGGFDWGDMCRL
jgi:hypothetical protein